MCQYLVILQYRSPVDHDSQAIVVMGDVSVTKRIRVDAVTDLLLLIKRHSISVALIGRLRLEPLPIWYTQVCFEFELYVWILGV